MMALLHGAFPVLDPAYRGAVGLSGRPLVDDL
jgi:hypothetical protein